MLIRSPIIAVLGHVDHGKTSLLDAIRGTTVAKKEAGGITQMIGASYVSKENIEKISKTISEKMKIAITVPGILLIDTPGHEAFTHLRERGGSIADIVILVIDINQGVQPQTVESIQILKDGKTPFLIAANKIDLVSGWKSKNTESFLESFFLQSEHAKNSLDTKIYELIGKLSEYGFDSERFDRVHDFTKQLGIIPMSAKTKEGLGELLVLIAGLSQKFLEKNLYLHSDMPAKGSIMEVKEEKGMGSTIDVIIYDGVLKTGDEILYVGKNGIKKTKVRGLFQPNIQGAKEKFKKIDYVVAAAGVKISAPELEDAISGSPVIAAKEEDTKEIAELEIQMKKIIFENNTLGVIVRANSLGSTEAILKLLKTAGIPVKVAGIGSVSKNDVLLASNVAVHDKYLGVVFAFNVQILQDAKNASEETGIPILSSNIIYQLFDLYNEWKKKEKEKEEILEKLPWPCKIKVLPNCFFRISKPAIFGIEVLAGKLKSHTQLMNSNGIILGEIKTMQKKKETLEIAEKGEQVAISVDEIILNNNVKEGDIFVVSITKSELEKWKKKTEMLNAEENEILAWIEKLITVRL